MLAFYLSLIDNESDRQKFERIYNKYYNVLLNTAYGILKNKQSAEDAVHEAFLRILKCIDKIDENDNCKTMNFLITIVKNKALNIYNKQKKIKTVEFPDELIADKEEIASEITAEYVAECIKKLPEIYKDALMLKCRHDCSYEQMAKILKASEATARKRVERARKSLGEMLNEE